MLAWRLLGMAVVLMGMLCACSTPGNGGMAEPGAGAAVSAKETPKERHVRLVFEEVQKKWSLYRTRLGNKGAFWSLNVEFYVNEQGEVESIHVHNDRETHEDLARYAVRAIQEAEIPPMPGDVIAGLKGRDRGRLRCDCVINSVLRPEGPTPERRRASPGIDKTIAAKEPPQGRCIRRVTYPRGGEAAKSCPTATLFTLRGIKDAEIPLM